MSLEEKAEYFRPDGVRITHDPFSPEMVEKYGKPGKTDREGFDPYADSVGPGIYGGVVKRDEEGHIIVGRQYQNHNPRPGPVYAGGGYTPTINALRGARKTNFSRLRKLLDQYPDLVNDITTGGATPLHMCGMGKDMEGSTEFLIRRGGAIEQLDTYGMTPLHRCASNNLAEGARALLLYGADFRNTGTIRATPLDIARDSRATAVIKVLEEFMLAPPSRLQKPAIEVTNTASKLKVNGVYFQRHPHIVPLGFSLTCAQMRWDSEKMWQKLSDRTTPWFEIVEGTCQGAYIYWNKQDSQWWIDMPDGAGAFVAKGSATSEMSTLTWRSLIGPDAALPVVLSLSPSHPPDSNMEL